MKNFDVLIVRFLPFVLFIQIGVVIIRAWNGMDDYPFNLLHSNSAIYALALFFISLSNKRYHCSWNRWMYAYLVLVPIMNYLDAKFDLIPSVDYYFWVVWGTYFLTMFVTAYLAIRHFLKINKLRREKEFIHNGR